ncbi:MAG TPA: ribosome maturation factor RimM [Stellaceae bacterium]|nr:ribosome maturation factor RimM [Stellaceae bacterium]
MAGSAQRVCLGVVTAPHGVKGMVRVKSFTAEPEALARYGPIENEAGERVALTVTGAAKGVLLAAIDGVADRDGAERIKGMRLYLPRAALPPTEEEEFYHADLLGLAASLEDGTDLGRIAAIHDFGAGATLEIARAEGASILVPFTRAAVPVIDIDRGRVVVAPPVEA